VDVSDEVWPAGMQAEAGVPPPLTVAPAAPPRPRVTSMLPNNPGVTAAQVPLASVGLLFVRESRGYSN
jgi:hypothetical protein